MSRSSRLAARAHSRQLELIRRTDRILRQIDRLARAFVRELVQAVKRGMHHQGILQRLRAVSFVLRRFVAMKLYELAARSARSARAALVAELPRPRRRRLKEADEPEDWWADLLAPFRTGELLAADATDGDILSVLFAPPSVQRTQEIVYASGWQERLRSGTGLASPEALAARISTGMMLGYDIAQITREILPVVQGVASSARRIARTESMRVAAQVQMDMHRGLGDLVVGYQIHATLDERTRPEHRARDGTIYYANPGPDQLGYDQMPHPPQEADGSLAWNCRCFLTPVLRES